MTLLHHPDLVMYDSVDLTQIPAAAKYIGAYVNGQWPTYAAARAKWPHARIMGITVNAKTDAECLDVEQGDAHLTEAPDWVFRQLWRGAKRPCIYADYCTMPVLWGNLKAAGVHRTSIRLWVAEWTNTAHIPPGYGACQWTCTADGHNLDESLLLPGFFTGVTP